MSSSVVVVGGGLAGCEAAWQLAERGTDVLLVEQKPRARTPAQSTDDLAELVCSNSMRGSAMSNAVGLLKAELRRAGSLVMRVADATRVPAGGALAVDREQFSKSMTECITAHARIRVVCEEVRAIPEARPVVLATGPLTSDALATALAAMVGQDHLAYYDAIAPIVSADSIDETLVFRQSRYGKGERPLVADAREGVEPGSDVAGGGGGGDGGGGGGGDGDGDGGDDAYVNCPFDEPQYRAFVQALRGAEKVAARAFEQPRYFEGCLPVEVMAERGEMTLAFGPMKPVGLVDPRTGRRPFAVVQLRAENRSGTAYNLVGFQSRMTYGEQQRVLRMIPGLEHAEFLRFGSVHRNTFINAPCLLDETMQLRVAPGVYVAGQLGGVEGYVESAASGFLCAVFLAAKLCGRRPLPPPCSTALAGLLTHLSTKVDRFQPSNITWALVPPPDPPRQARLKKRARYEIMAERALADLPAWLDALRAPHD